MHTGLDSDLVSVQRTQSRHKSSILAPSSLQPFDLLSTPLWRSYSSVLIASSIRDCDKRVTKLSHSSTNRLNQFNSISTIAVIERLPQEFCFSHFNGPWNRLRWSPDLVTRERQGQRERDPTRQMQQLCSHYALRQRQRRRGKKTTQNQSASKFR